MSNKIHQTNLKKKAMYSRAFSILNPDAICETLAGAPIGLHFSAMPEWHIHSEGNNHWLVSDNTTIEPLYDIQMEYRVINSTNIDFSTSFSFIGTIPHKPK